MVRRLTLSVDVPEGADLAPFLEWTKAHNCTVTVVDPPAAPPPAPPTEWDSFETVREVFEEAYRRHLARHAAPKPPEE